MNVFKSAVGWSSTALVASLVTGCSVANGESLADEICMSMGSLIDADPGSDSGAEKWYAVWELTGEIRSLGSDSVSDQQLAVAIAMEDWTSAAIEAVEAGEQWPLLGPGFADAGLKLASACEALE